MFSYEFYEIYIVKSVVSSTGKHLCWSLFLIKRLQHICYPVKFAKLLSISFFTEQLQWLHLRFYSFFSKESRTKTSTTVSDKYQIQLKKIFCFRQNPEPATVGDLQKEDCNFIKPILKNICKRLLLKISTSVINLPNGGNSWLFFYHFKPFSILNFATKEWFCHMTCFAKVFLFLS